MDIVGCNIIHNVSRRHYRSAQLRDAHPRLRRVSPATPDIGFPALCPTMAWACFSEVPVRKEPFLQSVRYPYRQRGRAPMLSGESVTQWNAELELCRSDEAADRALGGVGSGALDA